LFQEKPGLVFMQVPGFSIFREKQVYSRPALWPLPIITNYFLSKYPDFLQHFLGNLPAIFWQPRAGIGSKTQSSKQAVRNSVAISRLKKLGEEKGNTPH